MKNLEIRTIEHKGVKVTMKIDYDQGEASLVEWNQGANNGTYSAKPYTFNKRSLEYMNGWLNVIEALAVAVKECKKELEFSLAQSSAFKEDTIIQVNKMLDEDRENLRKNIAKKKN